MDKRGTSMVEAAAVMPLVAVSVVVVILIMSFMIQEAACETKLHAAATAAMGRKTKTQIRTEPVSVTAAEEGRRGMRKCLTASQKLVFSYRLVFRGRTGGTKKSGVYEVNEKKYVRNVDLLRMPGRQAEKDE